MVRREREGREGLDQQIPDPVRWTAVIYKAALGVNRFSEVGAASVLTGLLRNIDGNLDGSSCNSQDLEKVHAASA